MRSTLPDLGSPASDHLWPDGFGSQLHTAPPPAPIPWHSPVVPNRVSVPRPTCPDRSPPRAAPVFTTHASVGLLAPLTASSPRPLRHLFRRRPAASRLPPARVRRPPPPPSHRHARHPLAPRVALTARLRPVTLSAAPVVVPPLSRDRPLTAVASSSSRWLARLEPCACMDSTDTAREERRGTE